MLEIFSKLSRRCETSSGTLPGFRPRPRTEWPFASAALAQGRPTMPVMPGIRMRMSDVW